MYADGLRELGYRTVLDRQMVKQPGTPLYFLIFAGVTDLLETESASVR